MLHRLGIRGKVLAALSGPVLVLILIAGLLTFQSASAARASGDSGVIADLLAPHADVVVALQTERAQATALAAGRAGADLEQARAVTDQSVGVLAAGAGQVSDGLLGGRIADLLGMATDLQAAVDVVRGRVEAMPESAVDTGYTQLIANVVSMPVLLSERMTEPDLAAEFRAYGLALSASEQLAHEAPLVDAVLANPSGEIAAVRRLPGLIALTDAALDAAREGLAALDDPSLALATTPGSLATLRQALSSGLPEAVAGADATQWSLVQELQGRLGAIRSDLIGLIRTDADALAAAANRQALLTAVGALAAVLLSLVLALTVARSIVRPMRQLTRAAASVRDELPRIIEQVAVPGQAPDLSLAEIPVTSQDEVGELAAAFNEVNATTIHVAQEQAALRGSIAEMFVNVARRDQVLLNRQLSFIDALERSEEDPKVLADLFRLDHLATRMRRNAESLLVLAGIDTGRRLRDTLPLSDVVRTASSEIEHYERVQLDLAVDPLMLGHTALPAAHLLAELLENATMFSEPGSPVHVSTGRDETHVIITVLDQGLGMSPEELADAQARIGSASAGEVLGAQRLGMFVIGRIAARLGAQVELAAGPYGTGTQATVRLPLVLFVDIADVPVHAPIVQASTADRPAEAAPIAETPEVVAEPVDLAELTDGATDLGLPRRRIRAAEPEAEASGPSTATIPVAPTAESLAGAAATEVENWAPPISDIAPLTRRRRGQHALPAADEDAAPSPAAEAPDAPTPHPWADGSRRARARAHATPDDADQGDLDWTEQRPTPDPATGAEALPSPEAIDAVEETVDFEPLRLGGPETGGPESGGAFQAPAALPARTPSAPVDPEPVALDAAPVAPEARVSMFSGFRSRRAEVIAEQLDVRAPEQLAVPTTEQIEAEPAGIGFVIPSLVEDEEWEEEDVPLVFQAEADETDDGSWAEETYAAQPWEAGYTQAPAEESHPAHPWEADHTQAATAADASPWAPDDAEVPAADAAPVLPEVPAEAMQDALVEASADEEWTAPQPATETAPPPAPPAGWTPPAPPAGWATPAAPVEAEQTSVPDFATLVAGEAPAAPAEPKRRRGLFGRRAPKPAPEAVVASTPAAEIPPPLPADPPPAPVAPARQSVWSANGAHVQPTWAPTDADPAEASTVEAGLPAAEELASLAVRPTPTVPEEPVAVAQPEPEAPAAPTPSAPPAAPVPAAPASNSWLPDPDGLDLTTYAAWPSFPSLPDPSVPVAAEAPAEDEAVRAAHAEPFEDPTAAGARAAFDPAPLEPRPAPAATRGVPSQHSFATFVPADDSRDADPVALRAGIAQQALAELSQLSAYRPQTAGGTAPALVRRTPAAVPRDTPAEQRRPAAQRDANEVRSLLASFQSGTTRGRTDAESAEPVTTPSDAAQQGTSR